MTRKDYILIEQVLKDCVSSDDRLTPQMVSERFAARLTASDPRFSREHFLAVVRGEKELNSKPVS